MALNYLRQYVKAQPSAPPSEAATEPPPGHPVGERLPVELLLGARVESNEYGQYVVAETVLPAGTRHGLHTFGALDGLTAAHLADISRDPELEFADLSTAVFLDTETTGLNMGTGTYVFLVGAGYFDGTSFVVRQYFLRSPGEETAYLAALAAFLREFAVLVTFNGKAFDWPLLENRYLGNRTLRRAPFDDPPHVDLLHPARRIWKRRLSSCALSSLEQTVLGVSRTEEDVPGYLIPSLYFQYLRHQDGAELQRVFYHNLTDILSLATLAVHIHSVMADPLGGLVQYGQDFLSLARTYEKVARSDHAVVCLEEALNLGLPPGDRADALTALGRIHKRERHWDAALAAWDRLIEEGGAGTLEALVERAKYYEHVERSYLEALDDVQHALNLLDLRPADTVDRRDLEHRQGRLLNRVYRQRSWAGAGRD